MQQPDGTPSFFPTQVPSRQHRAAARVHDSLPPPPAAIRRRTVRLRGGGVLERSVDDPRGKRCGWKGQPVKIAVRAVETMTASFMTFGVRLS